MKCSECSTPQIWLLKLEIISGGEFDGTNIQLCMDCVEKYDLLSWIKQTTKEAKDAHFN